MNPYQVLGVSPSATDEEIREAYRKLVKKYHPDRYQDSALREQAEAKLKEINAAYEMLTKKGANAGSSGQGGYGSSYGGSSYGGSSYGGSSYGGYNPYGSWGSGSYGSSGSSGSYGSYGSARQSAYTGQYAAEFNKVRSFINSGDIAAAGAVLDAIPLHNAEWYFLSGMCAYRNGQYSRAYELVSRACGMDPNNAEYRSAMNSMRGGYTTSRGFPSSGASMECCSLCSSILCMNLFCNCCCRRG